MREKDQQRCRIFVSGEWRAEAVRPYAETARKLGVLLAESSFDITCGPGSGITRFVLEGYYSVSKEKRGQVIFYLPKLSEMKRVGEKMEFGADIVVKTGLDYPSRNVAQVRDADALIAITGGAGTTTEIIHAALDFQKPVAILDKSGPMAEAIKCLPSVKDEVFFAKNEKELVNYITKQLSLRNPKSCQVPSNSVMVSV